MSAPDLSSISGNYFTAAQRGYANSLNGSITAGSTTIAINSLAGFTTNDSVFLWIEPSSSNAELVYGIVNTSTNQLTSCVRGVIGAATSHANGSTVAQYVSSADHQAMRKGILVQHNQDGTHGAITGTSATLSNGLTVSGGSVSLPNNSITNAMLAGSIANSKLSSGIGSEKLSNPYKFSVYRNAAQTISTSGVVLCDTKSFDTGSNVDVTTNKGRFTTPVNGFYRFNGAVAFSINGNQGTAYGVGLRVNGTALYYGNVHVNMFTGSYTLNCTVDKTLSLSASDYVELYVVAAASSTALGTGNTLTYFEGFLASAA